MNDLEKLKDSLDAIEDGEPLPVASIEQVCTALAAAQGEFKAPVRTKTAKVKGQSRNGGEYSYEYKYAPLEEIINSVKDTLAKNGLFYYQYLLPPRFNILRTVVRHSSGEFIPSDYPVFPTKDGAAGFASGVTYARRYGLSLALGLAPEDDDDNTETSAVGSPRMAEQPVPNSRSHSSPLDGGESQGTGDSSKVEFIASCRDKIRRFTDAKELGKWWTSDEQKQARQDFGVTGNELRELTEFAASRRDTLKGGGS